MNRSASSVLFRLSLLLGILAVSVRASTNVPAMKPVSTNAPLATTNLPPATIPIYVCEIVNVWPHDPNAFTQGLVFFDGDFLESTGLNGQSSLRKVELKTGKVLKKIDVAQQYFAEGLAVLGQRVFQLTYQNRKAFVYDLATFALQKEIPYEGEGWGLTTDGRLLIATDGSHEIRFLDPDTWQAVRKIGVVFRGQPVKSLNELEFVKGELFANVWGSNAILRIHPETGAVTGVIDCTDLLRPADRTPYTDVLNGIAYDAAGDRLFVTGKRWPKLFEIRLKLK